MEHFPPQAPRTLRNALRAGRLSVSQLVGRYPAARPGRSTSGGDVSALDQYRGEGGQRGIDLGQVEGGGVELIR